jgi:hypothetical protein
MSTDLYCEFVLKFIFYLAYSDIRLQRYTLFRPFDDVRSKFASILF